jgi:SAM-dependent methyltransferase
MDGTGRFTEDLPQLAADSFDLAGQLCGDCKNFHMLWPYHRLAQAAGGDIGIPRVQSALKSLLSQSGRKILIGGSADSGLLAVVARTASSGADITVLDRCETPLELCRRFASRWSLPIKTMHLDLQDLSIKSRFDVVFIHMLLQFIPSGQHLDTLVRVRRSLRPGGRMLLAFRINTHTENSPAVDSWRYYATHLIKCLKANKIPLPEPCEQLRDRLQIYVEERRERQNTYSDRAEVEALVKASGFDIENIAPIVSPMAADFVRLKSSLYRFLTVAKARDHF